MEHFCRLGRQDVHATVARARFQIKIAKNCIGAAARRKASVMLRRSWQAGLQLEVARRFATAARQVVFDCFLP